jgi:hypothetical protein
VPLEITSRPVSVSSGCKDEVENKMGSEGAVSEERKADAYTYRASRAVIGGRDDQGWCPMSMMREGK